MASWFTFFFFSFYLQFCGFYMLIGKGGGGGTDTVAMEIGGGDGGHNT